MVFESVDSKVEMFEVTDELESSDIWTTSVLVVVATVEENAVDSVEEVELAWALG